MGNIRLRQTVSKPLLQPLSVKEGPQLVRAPTWTFRSPRLTARGGTGPPRWPPVIQPPASPPVDPIPPGSHWYAYWWVAHTFFLYLHIPLFVDIINLGYGCPTDAFGQEAGNLHRKTWWHKWEDKVFRGYSSNIQVESVKVRPDNLQIKFAFRQRQRQQLSGISRKLGRLLNRESSSSTPPPDTSISSESDSWGWDWKWHQFTVARLISR